MPKIPTRSGAPLHANLLLAYLLGFVGVVIFGATLPVTRLALADFSPWFITFSRALLATIAALAVLLVTARSLTHEAGARILLAGLFLIFGFPGCMAIAMETVPAAHGGVVLGFLPLATAAIAAAIAGERHGAIFWLASILGAVLVVAFALYRGGEIQEIGTLSRGDLWLFLAGFCASAGYVISGKLARSMPGWEVICRALVYCLPITLIGTFATFEMRFVNASALGLASMAYLGLGSMFLGFFAWNTALAWGGIGRIGQVQLLQTFVTLAVSALLLGERIELLTLLAALAVTGLVALSRRS
ncbi:MAG: DMT family transporter [Rhizobiaceae bacterium]